MTKPVKKADAAGAMNTARDLTAQLQDQAKNGQIDGSLLDQLEAILKVSVDEASSMASSGASDASSVDSSTTTAPSDPSMQSSAESDMPSASSVDISSEPSTEVEDSSMPEDIHKLEPASSRAPIGNAPNLIFDHLEDYRSRLGDFTKSLSAGRMGDAQKLADGSSNAFDTMFNMAQHAILNEGGWHSGNLTKLQGMVSSDPLQKAITASSVPGIYLIKLAKLMLPVYAGLTNRIPTDSPKGMGSDYATWKAQLGFGTLDESAFFRVAEASIGVNPPTNFLTFQAPYNDLSVNDNVTLKALRTSAGYADPLQIGVIKAMSALLRGQERVILGGNRAAIGAMGTVTPTAGSAGAVTAGSYIAVVSALTYEGWLAKSGQNGYTQVGEGIGVAAAQTVVSSSGILTLTWPAVPGAVAYNVYMGTTGAAGSAAVWNKTVVINKAVITANSSGSVVPLAADTTVNATYGIEGLLAWCEKATIYSNAIDNKQTIVDNAGAGLTAGNGGITQFDNILANLWTTWHTAPSLMVMSPQMNATLVGKLQSLGSGNFYRIEVGNERNTVNGGMMVTGYVNKFAPYADGTPRMIDVMPHPYMPDGTILFLSETIPYPMGNETRGFVRDVLLPYTYFPLAPQVSGTNKTIYNFAITTSETVECFNPGPQAALVGVDYTL